MVWILLEAQPEALYLLMPLPFSSSDQSRLTAPMTEDRWTMSRVMIKVGLCFANGGILLQYVQLGGHDKIQQL